MSYKGIKAVIDKAGSRKKLGRAIGVTEQAIGQWLKAGYMPKHRAIECSFLYGIPKEHLMRPSFDELMRAYDQVHDLAA